MINEEVVATACSRSCCTRRPADAGGRRKRERQENRNGFTIHQQERENLPSSPAGHGDAPPYDGPLHRGPRSSVRALELALATPSKRIFLAAQKDPRIDDPLRDDICDLGVVATVIQNLKLPNGNVRVMVEGFSAASPSRSARPTAL